MLPTAVLPADAPAPIGPYSPAVSADPFVYLSGQTPIDPATGALVDGDVETQSRRALDNLDTVLRAAGLSRRNVVKANVYLVDMGDFSAMNRAYGAFFADWHPARTTVAVAGLPLGARVEIEFVARRP